jgi:integrase
MARGLTAISIDNMKPGSVRREIPDAAAKGLYLVVQPSGVKSFACRYRFAGKAYKLTLGDVAIGLATARKLSADALAEVAQGRNPVEAKKAHQRAAQAQQDAVRKTFRAIAEMHLKLTDESKSKAEKRSILERLVYPVLGAMPIESIRRSHVHALLDRIAAGEFARTGKPTPIMANRCQAAISVVFAWHADRDDDFTNPLAGMRRKAKEIPRQRTLTDDELRAIWKAAEANPHPFGNFVRFLLLTACRRSEASKLPWSELNGDWLLPAARNKSGVELLRPLSEAAQRIVASQPRVGEYVFSADGERHLRGYAYFKQAFDAASGTSGWTLHDLRRTARSLMARAGVPDAHAEQCLGHTIPGVAGTYNRHSYHSEKLRCYEKLAALIESIVRPVENVVAMRTAAVKA